MRKLFWIALLIMLPIEAMAGTITVQVQATTGPVYTKTFNMSDNHLNRLIAAMAELYPPMQQDTHTPIQNPTNPQILTSWLKEWMERTKRETQAAETASAPPIDITE